MNETLKHETFRNIGMFCKAQNLRCCMFFLYLVGDFEICFAKFHQLLTLWSCLVKAWLWSKWSLEFFSLTRLTGSFTTAAQEAHVHNLIPQIPVYTTGSKWGENITINFKDTFCPSVQWCKTWPWSQTAQKAGNNLCVCVCVSLHLVLHRKIFGVVCHNTDAKISKEGNRLKPQCFKQETLCLFPVPSFFSFPVPS